MTNYYTTPLPEPNVTPGPGWATQLNQILTLVEGHGHTGSDETQITPPAININGPLSFNNNDLSGVDTLTATTLNVGTLNFSGNVNFNQSVISNYLVLVQARSATGVLQATDSGSVLLCTGALTLSLPTPVAGQIYTFLTGVGGANLLIQATASATITISTTTSGANGTIGTSGGGQSIQLVAASTSAWQALSVLGTWIVT